MSILVTDLLALGSSAVLASRTTDSIPKFGGETFSDERSTKTLLNPLRCVLMPTFSQHNDASRSVTLIFRALRVGTRPFFIDQWQSG